MMPMDAVWAALRSPTIPVLRPKAALRRVDRLSLHKKPRRALRLLSRLARRNVTAAQFRLAQLYLDGIEVPRSRQDAIRWCEKAARGGLTDAQCLLAALYLSGPTGPSRGGLFSEGPGPDTELAYRWATSAAASGSADAKAILAHLHAHGPDALRDRERSDALYRESATQGSAKGALGYGMLLMQRQAGEASGDRAPDWIRKAADADIPLANYIFAHMLEHGIGRPADQSEAANYYKRSAQRGILQGQLRWGMLLIEGRHVDRNLIEGESWLRKAAHAGDMDAAVALGDLHSQDVDQPPNFLEAATWYRHAAERAHAVAGFKLAQLLVRDGPGLRQDLGEAVLRYCSAADSGCQPARTELARLLQTGLPAAQMATVREWFEAAAARGDHQAAFSLGIALLSGPGPDEDRAVFWLCQAAEDVVEAQYLYGCLLAAGRGIAADLQAGRRWIRRAADAGLRDAQVLLAEMMLNGRGGERDIEAAFRLFHEAAEAGHPGAAFAAGMILRGGYGIAADQVAAQAWLEVAAERGHTHARALVTP